MTFTYSVRHAVVTGAARGIGAAIARRLSSEGVAVAVLDLDQEAAEATAADIAHATGAPAYGFACDVRDRAALPGVMTAAADALGGLDTLVTNAGIARDGFIHKLQDEAWDDVLAVQLTGTFACVRACAPWLRTEGPGRVVCISSISAATGNFGQANYTAAKGGIVSFAKTAALELARFGTTVNVVRPGFVETAMTEAVPEELRQRLTDAIPLSRTGQPDDIAGPVAFLCSDQASYITGATLDVNGGAYM